MATQVKQARTLYGGQAVMEGIMIRGRTQATVAVRKQDGRVVLHSLPLQTWANGTARRWVLMRGVLILFETLVLGMKALSVSANEAIDDTDPEAPAGEGDQSKQPISGAGIALMMTVALVIAVGLFFLLPLFISRPFEAGSHALANVVEGVVRLLLFVGYIWLIGRMKEIKRVFGYHGAEHMAVSAHEHGDPLTRESLRKYPTAHPRCGTSFLLTVVLVSILAFMLIPREPFWLLIGSRVVLIPVITAVSYEFIRFAGFHREAGWVKVIAFPNLFLQNLTTRQPDDEMLDVAIASINHAIAMDEGVQRAQ